MATKNQTKMTFNYVNLEGIITPEQLMTLRVAEEDGWELYFLRQEGLEVPVVGIKNTRSKAIGVIDEDGNFNVNPVVNIRINPELSSIF